MALYRVNVLSKHISIFNAQIINNECYLCWMTFRKLYARISVCSLRQRASSERFSLFFDLGTFPVALDLLLLY